MPEIDWFTITESDVHWMPPIDRIMENLLGTSVEKQGYDPIRSLDRPSVRLFMSQIFTRSNMNAADPCVTAHQTLTHLTNLLGRWMGSWAG